MGSRRTHLGRLGLSLALAIMLPGPAAAQSASVIGSWEGDLEIPGGPALTVVYHIEAAADGSLMGTLDSPDQNAFGLELSTVVFTNGVLTAVAVAIPGEPTFVGTPSEDGTMLSGTFAQGEGSLPLELTKR